MPCEQTPPTLGNQYDSDSLLREYLERTLPPELLQRFEPEYRELGELSGGELFQLSLADLDNEMVSVKLAPDLLDVFTLCSSVESLDGLPIINLRAEEPICP